MPTQDPTLVNLRGQRPYGEFLDLLKSEAERRGHAVHGRTTVVEIALTALGRAWGIEAPPRGRPVGSNQHAKGGAA